MAGHDLEVGTIVDLDIDRCSSPRGRERDRSLWANIGEETVSVPRCLPLALLYRQRSCLANPKGSNIPHHRYSAM